MSNPRDFHADLEHSTDYSDILDSLYKELASSVVEIETITDLEEQKKWIDKKIRTMTWYFTLDEKIRYHDYGDILIEVRSNFERKIRGWTIDPKKESTYIVYYFVPTDKVIIINYEQLHKATLNNLRDNWIWRFPYQDAKTSYWNGRYYTTRNMAIPIYVLRELWVHMIIKTNVSWKTENGQTKCTT